MKKYQGSSQGQGLDLQGGGHKIWPRGASRPRPGLEDYITCLDSNWKNFLKMSYLLLFF